MSGTPIPALADSAEAAFIAVLAADAMTSGIPAVGNESTAKASDPRYIIHITRARFELGNPKYGVELLNIELKTRVQADDTAALNDPDNRLNTVLFLDPEQSLVAKLNAAATTQNPIWFYNFVSASLVTEHRIDNRHFERSSRFQMKAQRKAPSAL